MTNENDNLENLTADPLPNETGQLSFAFGFQRVESVEAGPGRLEEIGLSGYQDLYWGLCRQGWRWQKAAYMAWRAAPRGSRRPKTQYELAEMLGYAGDKIFRLWLNKPDQGPQMLAIIRNAGQAVFEAHLADVDWVTICQAKAPDSSTSERELFYKRYRELVGETGQRGLDDDGLDNLSDDEIEAELERLEQLAA